MLDPRNDLVPPPSSPTISSVSSSDLDTESTGSFFHDRSITLGTLMGVSFPSITFRASSQRHVSPAASASRARSNRKRRQKSVSATAAELQQQPQQRRRKRWWWQMCRDDEDDNGGGSGMRPCSLGEYLEVERRFGDEAFLGGAAAELEGAFGQRQQLPRNGRLLFADGRVLPPAETVASDETSTASATGICRFPVSLTGICSGGVG